MSHPVQCDMSLHEKPVTFLLDLIISKRSIKAKNVCLYALFHVYCVLFMIESSFNHFNIFHTI
jgi:hypothetical protein